MALRIRWLTIMSLLGALGPFAPPVQAIDDSPRYFAQFAVGHVGSLRFDTDFLFINSGEATEFSLEFFDSTGSPLSAQLFREGADPVTASALVKPLARGETLNLAVRLEGTLKVGYAKVTTAASVSGVFAFTRTNLEISRIEYQTGGSWALVMTDFTVPVKFAPGVGDMAFAIVNPARDASGSEPSQPARIVFRLYDESFRLRGVAEAVLPAGAHQARFIGELFPELIELAGGVGFNGSMTVQSSLPLAVMSVLHTEVPTLTVVPVTAGRADAAFEELESNPGPREFR